MKITVFCTLLFCGMALAACSKKNVIVPVSGTIAGKPAVSLYGNSAEPTDYLLIDTAATDKQILYDGIVFPYHYTTNGVIYWDYNNMPAVQSSLSITSSNVSLTVTRVFNTVTFASTVYTSK